MEDIPNKIVMTLGIVADVNLHHQGDLDYIEICVEPSNIPIAYKGIYHYRSGSTKQGFYFHRMQRDCLSHKRRQTLCKGNNESFESQA